MIEKLLKELFGELTTNKPKKECDCDECCKCDCECKCNNNELDLKKDEDYDYFKKLINQIREGLNDKGLNPIYKLLLGDDVEETLDLFDELGKSIHDGKKPEKKEPELPSSKTSVEKQRQIHKLVTEYVDTIIKPNTNMDKTVINDVYAGLFEFACWIMNK